MILRASFTIYVHYTFYFLPDADLALAPDPEWAFTFPTFPVAGFDDVFDFLFVTPFCFAALLPTAGVFLFLPLSFWEFWHFWHFSGVLCCFLERLLGGDLLYLPLEPRPCRRLGLLRLTGFRADRWDFEALERLLLRLEAVVPLRVLRLRLWGFFETVESGLGEDFPDLCCFFDARHRRRARVSGLE